MKKMRVLFLIRSLETGGAERQLVLLANALADRGHAVGVAVFYGGGVLAGDLDPRVKLFDLAKSGRWDVPGFLFRLWKCIKAFGPDVLHGYLGTPNNLSVLSRLAFPSLKVVWGVRASLLDYSQYGVVSGLDYRVQCLLARFADLIIVNSSSGKDFAVQSGMPESSIVVVNNGIDSKRFLADKSLGEPLRQTWGIGPDEVLIGLVARLDPIKGHEVFLEAARLLAAEDDGVRFVFVGGGSQELEERLRERSSQLGLDKALVWAGEVRDVVAAYNALDICCLSSLGEGFPNVLGEAMSCSVPCVATDVGDTLSIIGDPGRIARPGDPGDLAARLASLISDVRGGAVDDPRVRIESEFSVENMVSRTEALLTGLLEK